MAPGRWRDGGHHDVQSGRSTISPTAVGSTGRPAPARRRTRRERRRRLDQAREHRPIACGQYVPQWIGTAARGRIRRNASAALSGSRCRPRPRVGPQPQTGISARSIVAERPHPLEQVRVAGEVDRLRAAHARTRSPAPSVRSGGRNPEWQRRHGFDRRPRRYRPVARARSRATSRNPAERIHAPDPAGTKIGRSRPRRAQRRHVEVVPVQVRDEDRHRSGRRSTTSGHGLDAPQRPDPGPRRRVGQEPDPVELDEQRRVPDEVDPEAARSPPGGCAPRPGRGGRVGTARGRASARRGCARSAIWCWSRRM